MCRFWGAEKGRKVSEARGEARNKKPNEVFLKVSAHLVERKQRHPFIKILPHNKDSVPPFSPSVPELA